RIRKRGGVGRTEGSVNGNRRQHRPHGELFPKEGNAMKRLYRRQRQQYLLAIVLGVIAIVNVLFFLILYRPARGEYDRLQSSIERLRAEVQTQQQQVARLERLSTQLEGSEKDRQRL